MENEFSKGIRRLTFLTGFTPPLHTSKRICLAEGAGFTLVEIMIALAIIGVLATMSLPQFAKSRSSTQRSICRNSLRQIDAAIDRWVFENGFPEGGTLSTLQEEEVYSYIRNGKPFCPSEGRYTIGTIGTYPQVNCSIEDHILQDSTTYGGR